MKKSHSKKLVVTALAAIVALSSISMTVFADFPYEEDEQPMEQDELFMDADIQDGDYVQITAGDEGIYEASSEYNEVIGMTDDEVLSLYDEFLATRPGVVSEDQEMSQEVLEEFAQYAVEQGAIEDTAVQKAAITKALVRSEFKAVVAGGKAKGDTTAAALLDHSLQDHPSNLSYDEYTTYAKQIKQSTEFNTIVNNFRSYVTGRKLSQRMESGSTTLNSTEDLHLAYNKVSYVIYGTKKNNVWTMRVVFSDKYDFEKAPWKNAMTSNAAVTAINNYAAYAQSLGAIVPYDIKVTVTTTFTE